MADHHIKEIKEVPSRFAREELEKIVKEQGLMAQEHRSTTKANHIMIEDLRLVLENTRNIAANMELKARTATKLYDTYRHLNNEAHIDNNALMTTIESLRADLLAEQLCNEEHKNFPRKKAPKPTTNTEASTQVDNALGNNSTRWADIYDPGDLLSYDNNREQRKLNSYGITVTTQTSDTENETKSTQTRERGRHRRR